MTDHVHAVPLLTPVRPRQCAWWWRFEDVLLRCDDNAIPGGSLCAEHLVQANEPDPENR